MGKVVWLLTSQRDVRVLPALRWMLEQEQIPTHIGDAIGRLGQLATELVPLIRRRLSEPPQYPRADPRASLAGALGETGSAATVAVPEIAALLTADKPGPIALTLGKFGPEAAVAVPALRSLLDHADANTALDAAVALWRITGDADTVLPAIARHLDGEGPPLPKSNAAKALGILGPAAAPLEPRLRALLEQADDESDRSGWVRLSHAAALWRITGDADASVPVLVTLLLMPDLVSCLAEMGPAAHPAASLVRADVDSRRRYTVQRVLEYSDVLCDVAADEAHLRKCRSILANVS